VTDILDAITERMRKAEAACVELEADKEHAIKVSGDFIRLLHADIAELKARAIRAEAALAVTADEWLETAERLHAVCEKRLIAMADDDLPEDEFMAAPDRYQEAKNALRAHLRSHTAPEGFALVPVDLIAVFKHQRQCDEEGIEVAVSRQAVCELIDLLAAAGKE